MEVTHLSSRQTTVSSREDDRIAWAETEEVDLSRILQYVSPFELERFENEQFRIEAEAEAEVMREEAEEMARRRLAKNAKVPGMGRGSRMLSGLGLDPEAATRGRPRGRGKGRGRGSWRGRNTMAFHGLVRDPVVQEEFVDTEIPEILYRETEEEDIQRTIAETESEGVDPEEDEMAHASPSLMRSSFVANSALPASPVAPHRRLPHLSIARHGHPEVPDIDDSDHPSGDDDARSMSSAAVQLRYEGYLRGNTVEESEDEILEEAGHRSKRRRTASTASNQQPQLPRTHSLDLIDDENIHIQSSRNGTSTPHQQDLDEVEDSDAEEYAVEDIIEHYCDGGKKYYLVKWEGHDDSHDWLPEEDLAGAAELVAEYNERVRKRKQKVR